MPAFDPQRVYDEGDYDKSILKARQDLEQDYPGAYVFIHSREDGKVNKIYSASPRNVANVVQGRFEIKSYKIFGSTFGYDYYVMSEGLLSHDGTHTGEPKWMTVSDGVVRDMQIVDITVSPPYGGTFAPHQTSLTAFYHMVRKDGHPSSFRRTTYVDPACWMGDSRLDGKQLLSALTIPGTHNSHATTDNVPFPTSTFLVIGWVVCQYHGVRKQLELGVRFLDLRVGTGFKMVHGRSDLKGIFWDVIDEIIEFLENHPSETVLVSIKWDEETFTGTVVPEPPTFGPDMDKMTRERGSWYTGTSIPTLDAVRGKMVLVRRFSNSTLGLEFDKHTKYANGGIDFVMTQPTRDDTLWLTWLSGYDWEKKLNPWDIAVVENEKLDKYLNEKNRAGAVKMGGVMLDFVDQLYTPSGKATGSASALVEKLLLTNFE